MSRISGPVGQMSVGGSLAQKVFKSNDCAAAKAINAAQTGGNSKPAATTAVSASPDKKTTPGEIVFLLLVPPPQKAVTQSPQRLRVRLVVCGILHVAARPLSTARADVVASVPGRISANVNRVCTVKRHEA
jgi:hypothetical protein